MRPNFFIVGAMKSATTSLHRYLSNHPDIFMCEPKEPGYFVDRDILKRIHPVMEAKGIWKSEQNYLGLFKNANGATIIGESSTSYTKRPLVEGTAERIIQFSPDARILYIMRHPVERTISHYWHEFRSLDETRSIDDAIRQEPFYRQVSNYAMQIEPYLNAFGRERVFLTTFERLNADPTGVITEICHWLAVEEGLDLVSRTERQNVTPETVYAVRGTGTLNRLRYSRLWDQMGPRVPRNVRQLLRGFAEKPIDRKKVSTDAVRQYLAGVHRPEVDRLKELTGMSFSEWTF